MSRTSFLSLGQSTARIALATAGFATLAIVAACSEGGVAGNVTSPSVAKSVTQLPGIANASKATVCVSSTSPDGTYTFVNSATNLQLATGAGTQNSPDGTPYTLTKNGGNPNPCVDVLVRGQLADTTALSDFPQMQTTVTNTGTPANVIYSSTDCVDDAGVVPSTCGNPSTLHANKFHGSRATFNFTAVQTTGCTYTFGWYKNQGNGSVPNTSFFGTASSWKTVLAYKGQGNLYYTLADQYIPAKLNVNGGPAPADVAQALLDAETFFTGRALGSTAGYTSGTLQSITTVLNNFNDGLKAGWPHC